MTRINDQTTAQHVIQPPQVSNGHSDQGATTSHIHHLAETRPNQLLNFHQQTQAPVVHNYEDFSADIFQDSVLPKDNWETAAVTQIITSLGREMSLDSRREYEIARAAALRMSEAYKDRLGQFRQQNVHLNHVINNNGYRRDMNFNLVMDPLQNIQNNGPNLPQVPINMVEATKVEPGAKRKVSSSESLSSLKKARGSAASRWTDEQDRALKSAVEKFEGRSWKAIAELVPERDHVQCLQRWKKVLKPGLVKGHWSSAEDALLLQLIQDEKMHSWAMVASKIVGRTAKQCRERWSLNLDPGINRSAWTAEEDQLLLKLHEKMGGKWSEIKGEFTGRTENAVKTRYKSLIRAKAREWTQDQDAKLIELRMKYGKNWAAIKRELPGRSRNAIKVRCKTLEYDNTTGSNQPV